MLSQFPERGILGDAKSDLFGSQSWQPPAPKVEAVPPPPPQPPPMTYRFAGRFVQDGKSQIFLSQGDTPIAVKPGTRLDGGYVVESITADAVALLYPPLTFKPLKIGAQAEVSLTALNLQGTAGRALAHEALATFRAPVIP